MRSTSLTFRQAAYAAETDEVPVLLLRLSHADLTDDILLSTDNNDTFVIDSETVRGTISNGENYIYLPMQIVLPDDSAESVSQCSIVIDNIDRVIMETVRSVQTPPAVELSVVLASTPDVIEAYFPNFVFTSVTGDAVTVTGTLSLGDDQIEPFPGGSILPSNFPGAY